jgi:hypothetical protein
LDSIRFFRSKFYFTGLSIALSLKGMKDSGEIKKAWCLSTPGPYVEPSRRNISLGCTQSKF